MLCMYVCVSACVYVYRIFFIHSSSEVHLGCFCILAIVKEKKMLHWALECMYVF